ncbi:unnamed protein product, partial [Discosporangium mesarthrocarpum]
MLAVGHATAPGGPAMEHRRLYIIGLDNWEFEAHWHQTERSGELQHGALPAGKVLLLGAEIHDSEWDGVFQSLMDELNKSQREVKGNTRPAAAGKRGHRKTPDFICGLLHGVLGIAPAPPRGGFSEAGTRAGGQPRDTAWPLVNAVVQPVQRIKSQCQAPSRHLFRVLHADLHLWLLEQHILANSQKRLSFTPARINAAMQMLQKAASLGGELAGCGHDMGTFYGRLRSMRETLDASAQSRATTIAERYRLPDLTGEASPCHPENHRLPAVVIPAPPQRPREDRGLDEARRRSHANLAWLPRPEGQSMKELVMWLKHERLKPKHNLTAQLAMRAVEGWLFDLASRTDFSDATVGWGEEDVALLAELVDLYRQVLHSFTDTKASDSRMRVELRSRELLVVWIAFCLVFAVARHSINVLQPYGVALGWDSLRHLVLS